MAPELPNTDSIFDWLYVDHVRVASYLAQLSNYGHLDGVTVEDRTEHKTGGGTVAGVSPLGIGKFESSIETSKGATSSAAMRYDPLWVNARSILDQLDELGRIQRDLESAMVGDIVVVSGEFSITDLRMMKPLWGPIFKAFGHTVEVPEELRAKAAPRHERRQAEKHKRASTTQPSTEGVQQKAFLEIVTRFFEEMPHAVQGVVVGGDRKAWFTMNPSRMSVSPEELTLEHGEVIPGTWNVLGVVDAVPGEPPTGPESEQIGAATRPIANTVREQFGRPTNAYGLTPLMVFRKLGSTKR